MARPPNYELQKFIERLEDLPTTQSQVALNRKLGLAFIRYVQRRFDQRNNPGGKPWAKRKHVYSWPILEMDSANRKKRSPSLRDSWSPTNLRVSLQGFQITAAGHAKYHQEGTKYMTARRMAPTRQLPHELKAEFAAISAAHVRKRLSKK